MNHYHYNPDRLWKGRSYKKGNGASDPRTSDATTRARMTIREDRDRSAREADRRIERGD